jgi:hypothetical protein
VKNPEIDIIRIDSSMSTCKTICDHAILWKNNGDICATPWDKSFGEWGIGNKLYELGELGFTPFCLGVYLGIDKNGLACYATFDPDF